jgi:hypothetical protein
VRSVHATTYGETLDYLEGKRRVDRVLKNLW